MQAIEQNTLHPAEFNAVFTKVLWQASKLDYIADTINRLECDEELLPLRRNICLMYHLVIDAGLAYYNAAVRSYQIDYLSALPRRTLGDKNRISRRIDLYNEDACAALSVALNRKEILLKLVEETIYSISADYDEQMQTTLDSIWGRICQFETDYSLLGGKIKRLMVVIFSWLHELNTRLKGGTLTTDQCEELEHYIENWFYEIISHSSRHQISFRSQNGEESLELRFSDDLKRQYEETALTRKLRRHPNGFQKA